MARIVKEEAYAVKRNEILDVAQRLVYTKGYEQMTIQDILDELQISKGAFYHYFDSKQALLEAVIERIGEEAEPLVLSIVDDPELMGRIVLFLLQELADALAGLLLAVEPHPDDLRRSERIVAAYTDALER